MPDQPNRRVPRLAGSRWRILVHEWLGTKGRDGIRYGRAYDVSSNPRRPAQRAETVRRLNEIRPDLPPAPDLMTCTVLAGTEFDELAVGSWIHLEQMDTGRWWCSIGGVTVNITADRDGRPRKVDVYGPDDYDGRRDGCEYSITWTGTENDPACS